MFGGKVALVGELEGELCADVVWPMTFFPFLSIFLDVWSLFFMWNRLRLRLKLESVVVVVVGEVVRWD